MNKEHFLTYNEFIDKFKIKINFLDYMSTIEAVKKLHSKYPSCSKQTQQQHQFQPGLDLIMKTKKGTSPLYQILIKSTHIPKGFEKWKKQIHITTKEWQNAFIFLKKSTEDTKLRWLQFRILHSILTTNRSVSKYNTNQSDKCSFCRESSETIHHLIWKCPKVQFFWKELAELINIKCAHSHNFTFNERLVLFGQCQNINTDSVCDFIILTAKMFLYRCKVQKLDLSINHFKNDLFQRYCVEKYIQNDSTSFRNSWDPYMKLFETLPMTEHVL